MAARSWQYYQNALMNVFGSVQESEPQWGYYRHWRGHLPVAIFDDDEGRLWVKVGNDDVTDPVEQGKIWLACARRPVHYEHWSTRMETGAWPGAVDLTDSPSPGDNSGSLDDFARMRAELSNDVAEARAYAAKNPIKDKAGADLIQDKANRLRARAQEMDAQRLAETKPLRDEVDRINKLWNDVIQPAKREAVELADLVQVFARAEADRLRKEAEAEAQRQWEADQERKQREHAAEVERLRQQVGAETPDSDGVLPDLGFDLPPAPKPEPPPKVVTAPPKVMYGTGSSGKRTSVKAEAQTATIIDLKMAAAHFAEGAAPELIDCIQKLANRAIKARTKVPGIRFSWEDTP